MVDLLGRAGYVKEAENMIESMPLSPDVPAWGALLGACWKHGENEVGERVGRKLVDLDPHCQASSRCHSQPFKMLIIVGRSILHQFDLPFFKVVISSYFTKNIASILR